jgi:ABC-type antimicrobial peptide transport system permease subunit
MQLNIKATAAGDVNLLKKQIEKTLLKIHGEKDFSVMTQEDMLDLFSKFLNMATSLISGIAAISLIIALVGGLIGLVVAFATDWIIKSQTSPNPRSRRKVRVVPSQDFTAVISADRTYSSTPLPGNQSLMN